MFGIEQVLYNVERLQIWQTLTLPEQSNCRTMRNDKIVAKNDKIDITIQEC